MTLNALLFFSLFLVFCELCRATDPLSIQRAVADDEEDDDDDKGDLRWVVKSKGVAQVLKSLRRDRAEDDEDDDEDDEEDDEDDDGKHNATSNSNTTSTTAPADEDDDDDDDDNDEDDDEDNAPKNNNNRKRPPEVLRRGAQWNIQVLSRYQTIGVQGTTGACCSSSTARRRCTGRTRPFSTTPLRRCR